MLKVKRKEIQKDRNKLKNGLDKLQQTNEVVAMLQKELSLMQPELTKKVIPLPPQQLADAYLVVYQAAATETLLKQIREDQATADGVRRVVMEEEAVIFDSTVKTQVRLHQRGRWAKTSVLTTKCRLSLMRHRKT